jgi:hypothetical protein
VTWKLTWREHSFAEDDLTVAHLSVVCSLIRDSWDLSPRNGPLQCAAFLAAWLMIGEQRSLDDVMGELRSASVPDFAGALTIE